MRQTLKQRIVPEIDEREMRRESEKVSSYVEESLKDIAPIVEDDSLFDMDEMFDDMENMQDMVDDMSGQDMFKDLDSDGFAGDLLFGDGAMDMGGDGAMDMGDGGGGDMFDEMTSFVRQRDDPRKKGGTGRRLADISEGITDVADKTGKSSMALASLGKLFAAGAAGVLVGGFALSVLEGIWGSIKSLSDASPLLGSVLDMIGLAMTLFWRPVARMFGEALLPMAIAMLQFVTDFNRVFNEGGPLAAASFLASKFAEFIFSLPGLIVTSFAAIGGILGTAIGIKAGTWAGAKIGATLGMVLGPKGALAGAIIGGLSGALIAGFAGLLAAFNLDGITDFLSGLWDSMTNMESFLSIFVFGGFGAVIIPAMQLLVGWFEDIHEWIRGISKAFENDGLVGALAKLMGFESEYGSILLDLGKKMLDDFMDDIKIPELPTIPSFDVWSEITASFGGWPDVSWPGWGEFIDTIDSWNVSGFDWGDFIPEVSFDLPDFPSWSDLISTTVDWITISDLGDGGTTHVTEPSPGDTTGADPGGTSGTITTPLPRAPVTRDSLAGDSLVGRTHEQAVGRFASGGIVTDTMLGVIGEGRESEVVAPLSKLDNMIQSRSGSNIQVTVENASSGLTRSDVESAVEQGVQNAGADVDDAELASTLKRVVREINRMRSDMELEVEFSDQSKWEVRE